MKLWISIFALCQVSSVLIAQNTGGQAGGTAGGTPALQPRAQVVPAQTSPVQSPLQGTTPLQTPLSAPAAGTLGLDNQGSTLQTSPGGQLGGDGVATSVDDGVVPSQNLPIQTPSGVDRMDPIVASPISSLPPPIRSGLQARPFDPTIIDPSGATPERTQGEQGAQGGAAGAKAGTRFSTDPNVVNTVFDEAFSQQFQGLTSRSGTTQVAFPNNNGVVTIISRDGNLTLQGMVGTEQQRENLEQAVRQISTGGFIDNQLLVVPRN